MFDGPLDCRVHFLFDLVQRRPPIHLALYNFVCLQELLELIRQFKVLLGHHGHMSRHFSDLSLLLIRLLFQLFGLRSDKSFILQEALVLPIHCLRFMLRAD